MVAKCFGLINIIQTWNFATSGRSNITSFTQKRYIEVAPDTVCDFTALPFESGSYKLVVFDPPHLTRAGDTSWTALKYGVLKGDWKEMLRRGFAECFRVLDDDGVLIFKWSEVQIPLKEILPLAPYPPLFGNRSGKNNNTHWLCFMKPKEEVGA